MFAPRNAQKRPRQAQPKKFVAPVAGWVANRALADPASLDGPGAQVLDNFFPRATSVSLRRGKQRHASLEGAQSPTLALFSYRNGLNQRLFGASDTTIFDLSDVPYPIDVELADAANDVFVTENDDEIGWASTAGLEVAGGFTSGAWITAQFATTGGVYLIGVNGKDTGFIYDGDAFYPYVEGGVYRLDYAAETVEFTEGDTVTGGTSGATATIWRVVANSLDDTGYLLLIDVTGTFADGEPLSDAGGGSATASGAADLRVPGITFGGGLTTADMSYVWVYKNRLFFAEKDSMNAWYAKDVDAIGGEFDVFPLAGIYTLGGSLLFGSPWSLDSSGDSGLTEQCVFVSTEGEVAVFQGSDPSAAQNWSKAGLYRIGRPLGNRAFMRGGGDLAIATTVGLVPLSKAISLDITALNVATVSYKIADAWRDAVEMRGDGGWICEIWPEAKMAVVAPPNPLGMDKPVLFVSNTETGAWCRFTGWHVTSMEVFQGRLYFGSPEGAVFIAHSGGTDDGATYTGVCAPLFDDMGSPFSSKIAGVARARSRSFTRLHEKVSVLTDFNESLPPPPDASAIVSDNAWGTGIWGQSVWGDPMPQVINQQWQSVGGIGYSLTVCYQVTSGSLSPIDVELLDLELMYTPAEMVT